MQTFECLCHACGMEYDISFNANDFHAPKFCAGCGIDDESLEVHIKPDKK